LARGLLKLSGHGTAVFAFLFLLAAGADLSKFLVCEQGCGEPRRFGKVARFGKLFSKYSLAL
jgi:hypothetical protein